MQLINVLPYFLQVTFKPDLSTAEVHDENIKGPLKVKQEITVGRRHCHSLAVDFFCRPSATASVAADPESAGGSR